MPTHIEPRSKYRRAAACNPPMGWMQTCSTHNIPPPALSFSGSPVDRCPLLAMHWPNILGVGSWRGGSDVDKWDRGVSNDPRGLGEGGSNSAETDLVFEGFVLAMLSLPPPLFILLYLCEKVIVGVKWRPPPHSPNLSTRVCTRPHYICCMRGAAGTWMCLSSILLNTWQTRPAAHRPRLTNHGGVCQSQCPLGRGGLQNNDWQAVRKLWIDGYLSTWGVKSSRGWQFTEVTDRQWNSDLSFHLCQGHFVVYNSWQC